jgi:hypothetical protein
MSHTWTPNASTEWYGDKYRRLKWHSIALVAYCKPHIHTGGIESSHDTSWGEVNQQHYALEIWIPRPTQSRCQDPPIYLDRVLLGGLTGAARGTLVAPAATGKVRLLIEIRFDSVGRGYWEVMPAQGLCRSSFEELDLGFYQGSLCFIVVSVSRVLVLIGLWTRPECSQWSREEFGRDMKKTWGFSILWSKTW